MNARRTLMVTSRALGDVQALRTGRVWQRVFNRVAGKFIGRATRKVWR